MVIAILTGIFWAYAVVYGLLLAKHLIYRYLVWANEGPFIRIFMTFWLPALVISAFLAWVWVWIPLNKY